MRLTATVAAVPITTIPVALLGWTAWTVFQARHLPKGRLFLTMLAA